MNLTIITQLTITWTESDIRCGQNKILTYLTVFCFCLSTFLFIFTTLFEKGHEYTIHE